MNPDVDELCSESCFAEAQTADDSHVIRNVLLCGNRSRNGYEIPPKAFGSEANVRKLYDKKPVFLDHEKGKELSRKVKELAGVVINPRFVDGKPYGDLDTESCPAGPELLALARRGLPDFGMSHIAAYTKSRTGKVVESVDAVVSVDVVFRPATTNTFFERTNDEENQMELSKLNAEQAAKIERLHVRNAALERENQDLRAQLETQKNSTPPRSAVEAARRLGVEGPVFVQRYL